MEGFSREWEWLAYPIIRSLLTAGAYCTKEVNPSLIIPPSKFYGGLAKLELTSVIKQIPVDTRYQDVIMYGIGQVPSKYSHSNTIRVETSNSQFLFWQEYHYHEVWSNNHEYALVCVIPRIYMFELFSETMVQLTLYRWLRSRLR